MSYNTHNGRCSAHRLVVLIQGPRGREGWGPAGLSTQTLASCLLSSTGIETSKGGPCPNSAPAFLISHGLRAEGSHFLCWTWELRVSALSSSQWSLFISDLQIVFIFVVTVWQFFFFVQLVLRSSPPVEPVGYSYQCNCSCRFVPDWETQCIIYLRNHCC